MATDLRKDSPLAAFVKLGPSVYLQEPLSTPDNANNAAKYPQTIFLAFWMNAPPRALAKYVTEYRRLAPFARIIFVRSSSSDFLVRSAEKEQQARVAPAVEALRASGRPDEPVFLHMFSNGGVFTTTNLLEAYRKTTGYPLRVSSMIFDSAPGIATIPAAVRAIAFVLPQTRLLHFLCKLGVWIAFTLGEMLRRLLRRPHAVHVARKAINDRALVRGPEDRDGEKDDRATVPPRRCYVYSDADDLVHWRDVERHATAAESAGWAVQREKFLGSAHVAHMKADPERYWGIVTRYLMLPESA